MRHYDYIISGAGAAGLSLLMRMMQHTHFDDKKILVVDKAPKTSNDHTWCFWEKRPGLFESVVHHQWQKVHFFSSYFSSLLDLAPYTYKMIRSIDFYNYVLAEVEKHENVTLVYGNIDGVGNEGQKGFVEADGEHYLADYVFNSVLFEKQVHLPGKYYLLQHFKGLVVETSNPAFSTAAATLMDFRVSQEHGTTFVYVLPLSDKKALVEYTLFTKSLLKENEYRDALNDYIGRYLKINNYKVVEEEFGVIPMTNHRFLRQSGRVLNIGSAGGQTKASTGYTFQFIQKQSKNLVEDIVHFGRPKDANSIAKRRFKLYDSTLLNILHHNKMPGYKIFADMFKNNPTERVLRFLDNESSMKDEMQLMATLPQLIFMKAAFQEMLK